MRWMLSGIRSSSSSVDSIALSSVERVVCTGCTLLNVYGPLTLGYAHAQSDMVAMAALSRFNNWKFCPFIVINSKNAYLKLSREHIFFQRKRHAGLRVK